jgi:WD40 repeat protein
VKNYLLRSIAILFILLIPPRCMAAPAAKGRALPVQFSRQILPLLRRECSVCHAGPTAPGLYSMETAERLIAGGRHGTAAVAGKSSESTIIKYLTGEIKPQMPPGKPLTLETVALVRRWIDEGAKIDSMTLPTPATSKAKTSGNATEPAPDATRLTVQTAPVTALAYSPDGKLLAAGDYRAVRLLDTATGQVTRTLTGPVDQVLALAWTPDGKTLAAAGGLPGAYGEVCLWNTTTWGKPQQLKQHADTIYGISFRPGAAEFATASLDKTVAIWTSTPPALPRVSRTLKDHADAIFGVAYSPDGKWMATCSADRTVKLYDAGTQGRPVASLSHGDAVTALAFSAKSDLLATACADKKVRVWPVKTGSIDNPLRSQDEGEAVNAVAFSPDGSSFLWGAANHKVKEWNNEVATQKRELTDPADWVYAVAISPDGKTLVAGAGDGKVYFWNEADGKLLRSLLMGPGTTAVAAGVKR